MKKVLFVETILVVSGLLAGSVLAMGSKSGFGGHGNLLIDKTVSAIEMDKLLADNTVSLSNMKIRVKDYDKKINDMMAIWSAKQSVDALKMIVKKYKKESFMLGIEWNLFKVASEMVGEKFNDEGLRYLFNVLKKDATLISIIINSNLIPFNYQNISPLLFAIMKEKLGLAKFFVKAGAIVSFEYLKNRLKVFCSSKKDLDKKMKILEVFKEWHNNLNGSKKSWPSDISIITASRG